MERLQYNFDANGASHSFELMFVKGTGDQTYLFGTSDVKQSIRISDFFLARYLTTESFWKFISGTASGDLSGDDLPHTHVTWNDIMEEGGFLSQLNNSDIIKTFRKQLNQPSALFRLPSETEWEYAARGGLHWKDNFEHSGSNNIDEVAWYQLNSGDRRHPVGQKAPNQLGLYDMNGNLWEWCEDALTYDTFQIPKDGRPYRGESEEMILRGGCFHNWAIHSTVSKRYAIGPEFGDGCIGFRLALGYDRF